MKDETSKHGNRCMGYEAAGADGKLWVFGLREIETKSAQDRIVKPEGL